MSDAERVLFVELANCVVTIGDRYLQISSVEAEDKHTVGQIVRRAIEIRDRMAPPSALRTIP